MHSHYGIAGTPAPDFGVQRWLANVDQDRGLSLRDIEEPVIYLYSFQSWCPACHHHGFPLLGQIKDHYEQAGKGHLLKFVAVQTVFEGFDANTEAAALEALASHDLTDIAVGHTAGTPPAFMADYRTGGTPWTVLIGPGPDRTVLSDGFQLDPSTVIDLIDGALLGAAECADDPDQDNHPDHHNHRDPQGHPLPESPQTRDTTMTSSPTPATNTNSYDKNDDDLRNRLTAEQFDVTQNAGTERAFTGKYWDDKTPGRYHCIVCDTELFASDDKYDSGTGWPSFTDEIEAGRVARVVDRSHGMTRTEARCTNCDAHLGHVFPDGPTTTGDRYCMNSASLRLDATNDDEVEMT